MEEGEEKAPVYHVTDYHTDLSIPEAFGEVVVDMLGTWEVEVVVKYTLRYNKEYTWMEGYNLQENLAR
jgi:hypothetical protein